MNTTPLARLLIRITFLLVCLLIGCASPAQRVKIGVIDPTQRPANPSGTFDILHPGQKPGLPIREIATFSFEGGSQDEAEAIGAMAQHARNRGADGLMIADPDAPYAHQYVGPIWRSQNKRIFRASAFVYIKTNTP